LRNCAIQNCVHGRHRCQPDLPQVPMLALLSSNCSWNATVNPACSTHDSSGANCSCAGNLSAGSCGGSCAGCAFNYTWSATELVFGAEARCLELNLRDGGPAGVPSAWYALSSTRPLRVARGALSVRPANGSCPLAFGSYTISQSCLTCHTSRAPECALRCECKAGTQPTRYVPMGCDLWECNDLALAHDSLTCRGAICPSASTPTCPTPTGSQLPGPAPWAPCDNCWVDDACLLRCECKTPPDGRYSPAACDLFYCTDIANTNGVLTCNGAACPAPPLQPLPTPLPTPPPPAPTPPTPSPPPPAPPAPSPANCEAAIGRLCGKCGKPSIVTLKCYEDCCVTHCAELKAAGCPRCTPSALRAAPRAGHSA
jgi:hypothetical protein